MTIERNSILNRTDHSSPRSLVTHLKQILAESTDAEAFSVYIYDLINQRMLSDSDSVMPLLGYSQGAESMGPGGLGKLIHPDDVETVAQHYKRYTSLQLDDILMVRYRMRQEDGTWCWLRCQETPLMMMVAGCPLQMLGLTQLDSNSTLVDIRKLALSSYTFWRSHLAAIDQFPAPLKQSNLIHWMDKAG